MITVQPALAILNTQVNPFEWTVPLISSNIGDEIPSLSGHTANLINNYMIVAFGMVHVAFFHHMKELTSD